MTDKQVDPRLTSRTLNVAEVQACTVLFDTPATLRKLAADAVRRGAELVVFPEAFVGGYPQRLDFGVTLGNRTPEGRDEFRHYFERGVEFSGPAADVIGAVARDHSIPLAVGTLYCTAAIFGPDCRLRPPGC